MSTHWKLTLAYDGTDFHGWQIQPGLPTLQGALSDAIARITGERVLPQGSGRTDAGVHALGQVASFSLLAPIPASNLMRALNRVLPAPLRVLAAEPVPPDFHARHSAMEKTYQYRIFPAASGAVCPPFLARYAHVFPWPLDLAAMRQATRAVLGEHDFTSFAATDPDLATRADSAKPPANTNIRILYESNWSQDAIADSDTPSLLRYTVRGNGFLHHMVRNLVGTFLAVGCGRFQPESIPVILAARDRSQAGPTAPASGLFLMQVKYPE